MLNKLKKLFPSLKEDKFYQARDSDRLFFTTKEGQLISILEKELSEADQQLLSVFLQPVEESYFPQGELDRLWLNRILNKQDLPRKKQRAYRFVYFEIEGEDFDPSLFKDAIFEIFQREVAILWQSQTKGVIVEEKYKELMDYRQIIDLLTSDLYVKIRFFIGQVHHNYENLRENYDRVLANGKLGVKLGKKAVFSYIDILPYKIIQSLDPRIKEELLETTLKDFKQDKETLQMIETFINCNLNVSLTAKQLYLHRNSLQYRIDKFIEETNIDLRQFHHALALYFALLSLREK